uniref:Metalloendopeptidase n=1 Tax=Sphaeramia orbicularis TaxID=375764 RepID=A0A673ADS4_9TELE
MKNCILHQLFACTDKIYGSTVIKHFRSVDDFGHWWLLGSIWIKDDRSLVIRTWPTLNIAYIISSELADRTNEILKALGIVSSISCVAFHKRTTEDNYLNFQKSKGCASYVGFNGGNQRVFLGPSCRMGNIVHEIFHALGTTHEHTRKDRDKYITVLSQNIKKGKERNFHKKEITNNLDHPYDLISIMHYGRFVFSRNGLPTIVTHVKDEDKVRYMGQRFKVTKLDGKKLRTLYHCGMCSLWCRPNRSNARVNLHCLVSFVFPSFPNKPEQ